MFDKYLVNSLFSNHNKYFSLFRPFLRLILVAIDLLVITLVCIKSIGKVVIAPQVAQPDLYNNGCIFI